MSLAAIGDGASYEFRWRRWALLRDYVAERMEDGVSGARFPQLAAVGAALAAGSVRVPAAALAEELTQIGKALVGRPLEELVIGPRTTAVLYLGTSPVTSRHLTRVELANLAPPGEANDLADYFTSLLDSLAAVCKHPFPDGAIEIVDG